MNHDKLRYLRLIVDCGSFDAAARAAGISQPSITRAMSTLEAELGVPLFERSGRRKVPTSSAHHVLRLARDFESRMDSLLQDAKTRACDAGSPARLLRAGLAPAAALLYGPALHDAWRRLDARGVVQASGGSTLEQLERLQSGRLDLAIVPRPRGYDIAALHHHTMHVTTPAIVARRGHPLSGATSLTDTMGACWAIAGRVGGAGNSIEEALRVRGLPAPRVVADCMDYMSLLHLVASSDLLCVVPHPVLVASSGAAPGLVELPVLEGLPRYDVNCFWRREPTGADADRIGALVHALMPLGQASPA